jgi:hypothetical protein
MPGELAMPDDVHARGGIIGLWLRGSAFLFLFSLVYLLCTSVPKIQILAQTKVYGSIFTQELLLSRFTLDMLWFVVAFALVHLLLAGLILLCWRWLSPRWIAREAGGYSLLLIIGALLALTANRCFFPQSFFSGGEEATPLFWVVLVVGAVTWLLLLLGGGLLRKPLWTLLLAGSLMLGLPWHGGLPTGRAELAARQHPDIILVGFDSLRPDVTGPTYTPHLDRYLQQAVRYPHAITPLARTYPAWMSILTGVDPIRHGARFNLIPDRFLNLGYRTLPDYLQTMGYHSLLAMDERRFANFSTRHGFDTIVGPAAGAGDFLLSANSDTPLLNFIRQIPAAAHLFPYLYNNRAAYDAYRGQVYVDTVTAEITRLPARTPLFAAIHFCMGHWPYAFVPRSALQEERFARFDPAHYGDEHYLNYLKAVSEADEQFGRLIEALKKSGRLENSLVFFLSDHGESFATDALNLVGTESGSPRWQLSINGHGTHASVPAQYRVLLAMQAYQGGRATLSASQLPVAGTVGLVDILPTVLDYLKLPPESALDGQSLLQAGATERDFFVESGFSVPAILTVNPSARDALQQGIGYYRVRPSGEIELKEERIQELIERKEYSHLDADTLLTYGAYGEGLEGFRHLDLERGTWQEVRSGAPLELIRRAHKLCRQFADDQRLATNPICLQQMAARHAR